MAFYDIFQHLSYSYRSIFTKLAEIIDTGKAIRAIHSGVVPDPMQSGYPPGPCPGSVLEFFQTSVWITDTQVCDPLPLGQSLVFFLLPFCGNYRHFFSSLLRVLLRASYSQNVIVISNKALMLFFITNPFRHRFQVCLLVAMPSRNCDESVLL